MAKRSRTIKQPEATQGEHVKLPRSEDLSANKEVPHFSLELIQNSHCVHSCETVDQAQFAKQLQALSKLTWAQILSAHRHGMGTENIPAHQIKASIPSAFAQEKHFMVFRFSGKKSMVGVRSGRTFYILWLDSKFKLYNHS